MLTWPLAASAPTPSRAGTAGKGIPNCSATTRAGKISRLYCRRIERLSVESILLGRRTTSRGFGRLWFHRNFDALVAGDHAKPEIDDRRTGCWQRTAIDPAIRRELHHDVLDRAVRHAGEQQDVGVGKGPSCGVDDSRRIDPVRGAGLAAHIGAG